MTSEQPTNRGAAAGTILISTALLCALVGFAIGSLLGVQAVLAIVGGFIGLFVGFRLVYVRFKDL